MNKRLFYLDNLKGFAMLLVILGHCGSEHSMKVITQYFYTFHVPIFFVISGFLYEKKFIKSNKYLVNYKILLTYYVFSLAYLCTEIGIPLLAGYGVNYSLFIRDLLRIICCDGIIATWYIMALIFSETIFKIIRKKFNIEHSFILCLLLSICASYVPRTGDFIYIKVILRVFPALLCLSLGTLISSYKNKLITKRNTVIYGILSMLLFIINGHIYFYHMDVGNIPLILSFQIIISSLFVFSLFYYFINRQYKFLTWWGKNTLIVLATHQIIIYILHIVLGKINLICFSNYISLFFITVIIEIPLVFVINKYFSILIGK